MIFTQFYSFWNDFSRQVIVTNDYVDHFLADLDFFGVLAPFFLGVLKSLSQTSHTQRPREEDIMSE